jgi:hypothetical protein
MYNTEEYQNEILTCPPSVVGSRREQVQNDRLDIGERGSDHQSIRMRVELVRLVQLVRLVTTNYELTTTN